MANRFATITGKNPDGSYLKMVYVVDTANLTDEGERAIELMLNRLLQRAELFLDHEFTEKAPVEWNNADASS